MLIAGFEKNLTIGIFVFFHDSRRSKSLTAIIQRDFFRFIGRSLSDKNNCEGFRLNISLSGDIWFNVKVYQAAEAVDGKHFKK